MTKTHVLALCVLTTLAVWALAGERQSKEHPPESVSILLEAVHSREGIGETTAISIVDRKTIEKLEAFFPNYRTYPSSDDAAGWEAGYRVYFNFSRGRTIRLTVSHPQNGGDTWNIGDGDFATRGDFPAFVKDLQGRAGR